MALLVGNPNLQGSSVQGLLGPSASGTGSPVPGVQSVGTQAASPAQNLTPANNTIPKVQQKPAVNDLSGKYGLNNGTVYNKQTSQSFSNSGDFFKDSGLSSFDNTKFDTAYVPTGKESIYGQPSQTPTITALPTTPNNGSSGAISPQPTQTPTSIETPSNNPYTPPNQGTTGVSQGGIIGNLIGTANNENPQVTKARTDLEALQNSEATAESKIEGQPIDMTLASGDKGILQRLFAAKQSAAQTALSSALTSQGQQITANTSAGQLNSPIIASPGQVQVSPSQPTPGSTISGAANLNSLIGQRVGADGKTTEFYNSQTGKGFSTPQQLADFVNQQMPGTNATGQNVFDILKNQGTGGSNLLGVNNSTMQTYAQMLATGQQGSIPSSVTGNMALMAQLYQMAQGMSGGNFNTNVAAGQGAAQQSNAAIAGTAAVNAANSAYSSYYKDYLDTKATVDSVDQFGNLLLSGMVDKNGNAINPTDVKFANQTLAQLRGQLSSPQQAQFDTTFAALKSKVSGLLSVGGAETPTQLTNDANSILSGSAPIGTLQATLDRIKAEGAAITNIAAKKGNDALQQAQGGGTGQGNSNSQTLGLF